MRSLPGGIRSLRLEVAIARAFPSAEFASCRVSATSMSTCSPRFHGTASTAPLPRHRFDETLLGGDVHGELVVRQAGVRVLRADADFVTCGQFGRTASPVQAKRWRRFQHHACARGHARQQLGAVERTLDQNVHLG